MNLTFTSFATTPLLLLLLLLLSTISTSTTDRLTRGFKVSPPSSFTFYPILTDPNSTFSFGFLPCPPSRLHLAVIHLNSSTPLWLSSASAKWRPSTTLLFNTSLLLLDPPSTQHITPPGGEVLLLLPTSNLLLTSTQRTIIWKSFDHPSHTIVQNQNFTSNSKLSSPNNHFYMSLGPNFIGLYMNYSFQLHPPPYFKRSAWEFRARIRPSKGPIYARVNASGYLGVYQGESSLVDLVSFSTFKTNADVFWRLTMEDDGNLRGYFWNGTSWVVGYEAPRDFCDLPSSCGPYGLCSPEGSAGRCTCLDNQTRHKVGECSVRETNSLCGTGEGEYSLVRRTGVTLNYKEYLGYSELPSMEDCEERCERNCSCWGVIYGNATGSCYAMDFPVETLVEGGEGWMGFFKVRKRREAEKEGKGWALKVVVGLVIGCLLAMVLVWMLLSRQRRRRNRVEITEVDGFPPALYKGLRENPSSGNIELPEASSK